MSNTIWTVEYTGTRAFVGALKEHGSTYSIDLQADKRTLVVTWSRYTTDGYGYHVGYERYTATWDLISRRANPQLLSGIPECVEPTVLQVMHPRSIVVEPAIDPDSYCEACNNADNEEECGNADCERYYPADEDFAWQHIEPYLEMAIDKLPEAVFDKELRAWTVGTSVYKLDEMLAHSR